MSSCFSFAPKQWAVSGDADYRVQIRSRHREDLSWGKRGCRDCLAVCTGAAISLGPKRTQIHPLAAVVATKTFAEPRQRQMIWEFAHIEGARRTTFSAKYLQKIRTQR